MQSAHFQRQNRFAKLYTFDHLHQVAHWSQLRWLRPFTSSALEGRDAISAGHVTVTERMWLDPEGETSPAKNYGQDMPSSNQETDREGVMFCPEPEPLEPSTAPLPRDGAWRRHSQRLGRQRRRHRNALHIPPTQALLSTFGSPRPATQNRDRCVDLFPSRSRRLPVLTAQYLLRRDHGSLQQKTELSLADFKHLPGMRGRQEVDVKFWASIIQCPSKDDMIDILVRSTSRPRPLFLLYAALAPDKPIRHPRNFARILRYASDFFVAPRLAKLHDAPANVKTTDGDNLTPSHFLLCLQRLVDQCMTTWPAALGSVSNLVAQYVQSIPAKGPHSRGQFERNFVYNYALVLFRKTAQQRPLENMKHNWEAMKSLLTFGDKLQFPLYLSRAGLRSVRIAMLGLKKSMPERENAKRYAKSWPPYRKEWDGIDEQMRPEDGLSMSVRAGMEMTQAGFPSEHLDLAMNALGGMEIGKHSTIQTRSLSPRVWKGPDHASLNVFSLWAAQVKATRNAPEAWKVFQFPPHPGLMANWQVYAEMFEKLDGRPVRNHFHIPGRLLPGDSKELWPYDSRNLTEWEKARIKPPSIETLYQQFLRGNRPVGRCLIVLMRSAKNMQQVVRYLKDSPYKLEVEALCSGRLDLTTLDSVRRLPAPILNAYVCMLCNSVNDDFDLVGHQHLQVKDTNLRHAISLVSRLLDYQRPEVDAREKRRKNYTESCHSILKALTGFRVLFSERGKESNQIDTFKIFLDFYDTTKRTMRFDSYTFERLCAMIRKMVKYTASQRNLIDRESVLDIQIAHELAMTDFERMKARRMEDAVDSPGFMYDITPSIIFKYLRVLASLGNGSEMVVVMNHIVDTWGVDSVLKDAKQASDPQFREMKEKVFGYVKAMGDLGRISPDAMQALEKRLQHLQPRKGTKGRVEFEFKWEWPSELSRKIRFDASADAALADRWASRQNRLVPGIGWRFLRMCNEVSTLLISPASCKSP